MCLKDMNAPAVTVFKLSQITQWVTEEKNLTKLFSKASLQNIQPNQVLLNLLNLVINTNKPILIEVLQLVILIHKLQWQIVYFLSCPNDTHFYLLAYH